MSSSSPRLQFRYRTLLTLLLVGSLSACSSSGGSSSASVTTEGGSTTTSSVDGGSSEGVGTTGSGSTDNATTGDGSTDSNTTSGDTAGTAGSNPDNLTGGTTTDAGNLPEPPVAVNLVSATSSPNIDEESNVTWSFDATPSGLEVHVQPFVEMPLASNGQPARWNDITSFSDRLFAVDEQDGRVYEITNRQANLWFDIGSAVQSQTGRSLDISNPFHGGVRGIAFHPDFASNGKFYATLMEQRPDNAALHNYISNNSGIAADSVLVEWTADTNTLTINPSTYREVFRVGVPEYDHPIKQIAFNPYAAAGSSDYGHLYIAHGDGSIESTVTGSGQNNDALGKILRINPLEADGQNYSIPADNPFISDASLPAEVYSYGHRNPHHLSFTREGHLLAIEAGRDNIEEVNLIKNGRDYGWAEREGAYVHVDAGKLVQGISPLPEDDAVNGYVYPVIQFGHTGSVGAAFTGQAIGGGHVVENGSPIDGQFFSIDFPKSGILYHSALSDILQANTTGAPSTLTNASSYIATVKFDHDSNPDTAALDNDLKQIVQSASGYVNTFDRVDVRIENGPNGVLYMMSKRNNMIYLVTSSLPGGPASSAARP